VVARNFRNRLVYGVCQDKSDTIISGALRRLTVSGSKPYTNALHRESNAEKQYQDHSVTFVVPILFLCVTSES
jgi:hypothetical protein